MPFSKPPCKRRRGEISPEKKKQLCQYRKTHKKATQREIRQHFNIKWGTNIARSTISDILRQKDKWLLCKQKDSEFTTKRSCKEPELERVLFLWFKDVQSQYQQVSCEMITEQAKKIGKKLGIIDFCYSNGWLNRFKKRHRISLRTVQDESAVAKSETGLQELDSQYALKDLHNVEQIESGIQRIATISDKHCISASNFPKDNNEIINEEGLADNELVNPPSKYFKDSFIENTTPTVTIIEATSAIWTVIAYLEQHSSLSEVASHLDSAWAIKQVIESCGKESPV